MHLNKLIIALSLLGNFWILHGQDPYRLINEVDSLSKLRTREDTISRVVLFTGSSSIRLWSDVGDYFPGLVIINTGFGGSHMSDLLFFLDELVLKYKPDQVIIYEGDNDLASGKRSVEIIEDAEKIVERINNFLPGIKIAFISPKPSLDRWNLKKKYEKLNKHLRRYADKEDNVDFIDIWSVMLDEKKEPVKNLFLEDGLHMNKSGYYLWAGEIEKFLLK